MRKKVLALIMLVCLVVSPFLLKLPTVKANETLNLSVSGTGPGYWGSLQDTYATFSATFNWASAVLHGTNLIEIRDANGYYGWGVMLDATYNEIAVIDSDSQFTLVVFELTTQSSFTLTCDGTTVSLSGVSSGNIITGFLSSTDTTDMPSIDMINSGNPLAQYYVNPSGNGGTASSGTVSVTIDTYTPTPTPTPSPTPTPTPEYSVTVDEFSTNTEIYSAPINCSTVINDVTADSFLMGGYGFSYSVDSGDNIVFYTQVGSAFTFDYFKVVGSGAGISAGSYNGTWESGAEINEGYSGAYVLNTGDIHGDFTMDVYFDPIVGLTPTPSPSPSPTPTPTSTPSTTSSPSPTPTSASSGGGGGSIPMPTPTSSVFVSPSVSRALVSSGIVAVPFWFWVVVVVIIAVSAVAALMAVSPKKKPRSRRRRL
jgi:hypothetical protein